MVVQDFENYIYKIQGKTVAVVYIFEGEDSKGFGHYDIWQSDVISEWLCAIQQNRCRPLIMDVRTFIHKAMNNTLPHIDFVLNLNAGATELSTLSLVPSVCSFLGIPCIPCNAVSIIAGEHKGIANYIAASVNLNLPKSDSTSGELIFRPLNYGSSRGVVKGNIDSYDKEGIYQEFIKGYDITTPILYNPLTAQLQVLPTIMYYPEDKDINWFLNEDVKEKRGGYKKRVLQIDALTESKYIDLTKKMGINCYCRVDARIKCDSDTEWDSICANPIPADKIFFIEMNPMPTLKPNINIHNALAALSENDAFYECYKQYTDFHNANAPTGFVLFCSFLAYLQPSIEKEGI